jgi:arsenate reductase (thioredoxin)
MPATGAILFLCPHNAAKSVLAVAQFERLVRERVLPYRPDSASTEPADAPAPAVVAALGSEGIDVADHCSRRLTEEDLARAPGGVDEVRCQGSAPPGVRVEQWDDVLPVKPRPRRGLRRNPATGRSAGHRVGARGRLTVGRSRRDCFGGDGTGGETWGGGFTSDDAQHRGG